MWFSKKDNTVSVTWKWLAVFFLAAFIGALCTDTWFAQSFSLEKGVVITGNRSWLPVEGKPVEVLVLNDESCGSLCDTTQALMMLRQNITPALQIETVEVGSTQGKKLIEDFNIKGVPAYVLGKGASEITKQVPNAEGKLEKKKFVELAKNVLTEKSGLYLLNEKSGLLLSQFFTTPSIDVKDEPALGSGSVQVVEFTDYQCPYCEKLYSLNNDLIDQLIEEEKITYVVKDFPLEFHKQTLPIHEFMNCVQTEKGSDAYFQLRKEVFDTQKEWSGNSDATTAFITKKKKEYSLKCENREAVMEEIGGDISEGRAWGVTGTPGLFIGRKFLPGAVSAEVFQRAVESELGDK